MRCERNSAKEEAATLRRERDTLKGEQDALEHDLRRALSAGNACQRRDCLDTAGLSGSALCGRAVLYVGGRSSLVQHYRDLVESHGAEFLHHDGGREETQQRLAEVLSRADVVCCPIDCVSHNAYHLVKATCHKHEKTHAFIRSASLSALAKTLGNLALSEAP